jgi:HEAT repeat protein
LLLRIARDDSRPRDVRRSALTWLANGVNDHLGIADSHDDSDEDEMRTQAVFVLSQRPKTESVPDLIELARGAKSPAARRSAIFWLGQTGDPRAVDVFAELLRQ